LFIGLALISIDLIALFKKKTLVSKYVWVAFAGTLMWTGFWLLFYTLPRNTLPLVYISFIFLITASIVLAVHYLVFHNKKVKVFAGNPLFKYIAIAGVLDGVGNAAVSFAYTSNPVLTPLSLAAVAPIVILLSFVFLRERFNKREIIGLVLIVAALVFALL
jgi:uncharacterized membrane protein